MRSSCSASRLLGSWNVCKPGDACRARLQASDIPAPRVIQESSTQCLQNYQSWLGGWNHISEIDWASKQIFVIQQAARSPELIRLRDLVASLMQFTAGKFQRGETGWIPSGLVLCRCALYSILVPANENRVSGVGLASLLILSHAQYNISYFILQTGKQTQKQMKQLGKWAVTGPSDFALIKQF